MQCPLHKPPHSADCWHPVVSWCKQNPSVDRLMTRENIAKFGDRWYDKLHWITLDWLRRVNAKPGGVGVCAGVCGPGFRNRTLGYGDRGPNHALGYGTWVKIKPLATGNTTNLTTYEANLMKLVKFGPNFVICLNKMVQLGQNGQNLLKIYPRLWSPSPN